MFNLYNNVTIINKSQICSFENEPEKLKQVKSLAEQIAHDETILFDSSTTYARFLQLVFIDHKHHVQLEQIFMDRLGPVNTYQLIKFETSIADSRGNKYFIEIPIELLKNKFHIFKGFESFNNRKNGETKDIFSIPLGPESLAKFKDYVYDKEWEITDSKMARELFEQAANIDEYYLGQDFQLVVMQKMLDYLAKPENELDFDEEYIGDNIDVFIEMYLENRGVDKDLSWRKRPLYTPEHYPSTFPSSRKDSLLTEYFEIRDVEMTLSSANRILFRPSDVSKISPSSKASKLLEFLIKNIPAIDVEIIEERDLAYLPFLPEWVIQKIAAFGLRVDQNLSGIPFSVYASLIDAYPHISTYPLLTKGPRSYYDSNLKLTIKTPYEWLLYSSYNRCTRGRHNFEEMWQKLQEFLTQSEYKTYILKELSQLLSYSLMTINGISTSQLIDVLEKQLDPKDPLQLMILGMSYYADSPGIYGQTSKNDVNKALEYSSRAIQLKSNDLVLMVPYVNLLCLISEEKQQTNEAENEAKDWYRKAIAAGIKDHEIFLKLAWISYGEGLNLEKTNPGEAHLKYSEAEKLYLEVNALGLKKHPNNCVQPLSNVIYKQANYLYGQNPNDERCYLKYVEAEKWMCESLIGSRSHATFLDLALVAQRQAEYLSDKNLAKAHIKYIEAEKWYLEIFAFQSKHGRDEKSFKSFADVIHTEAAFTKYPESALRFILTASGIVACLKGRGKIAEACQACFEAIEYFSKSFKEVPEDENLKMEWNRLKTTLFDLQNLSQSQSEKSSVKPSTSTEFQSTQFPQSLKRARDSESGEEKEQASKKPKLNDNEVQK